MKRILASVICAVPLLAFGADQSADKSFFKRAAEGGLAEVEAGNLAASKGNSQAVKDFGAMMVKDHSAANDKLKSVAAADNVSLPSKPSVRQMAAKTKLESSRAITSTRPTSRIRSQPTSRPLPCSRRKSPPEPIRRPRHSPAKLCQRCRPPEEDSSDRS